MDLPPPWNEQERHLRWMEMMWERNQTNAREERRTREVVEVFEGIADISRRRMEAPHFPPWESPW